MVDFLRVVPEDSVEQADGKRRLEQRVVIAGSQLVGV